MVEQQVGRDLSRTKLLLRYYGIAHDLMTPNSDLSDGLMRVSDMRKDIVVVKKPEERVTLQNRLAPHGTVSRILRRSPKDSENNITQVHNESDAWYIAVDDQALSESVNKRDITDFDHEFTSDFKSEVNKGIRKILVKEKLLNGENYNLGFFGTFYLQQGALQGILEGANGDLRVITLMLPIAYTFTTPIINLLNYSLSRILPEYAMKEYRRLGLVTQFASLPLKDEPYIRRHPAGILIAPPVPIDRLARGLFYLNRHGNKLIDTPDELKSQK